MILVIDNYDSFTYNLVQLIGLYYNEIVVVRNDKITADEIALKKPRGIVISPGPGRPENSGVCLDVIRQLGETVPVFGVCLGHQAIGFAFGGVVVHAPSLMHGKISRVSHSGKGVFEGLPSPFEATRYHSLVIRHEGFPEELEITASSEDGVIMGVRHRHRPIEGVQFHPESWMTASGPDLVHNWVKSLDRK